MVLAARALGKGTRLSFQVGGEESQRPLYRTVRGTELQAGVLKVTNTGDAPLQAVISVSGAPRVFLLSPANASGLRSRTLLGRGKGQCDLARRLRESGAPLGELFSFMSALYFRGKLAYATTFANPPSTLPGVLVIAPSRGSTRPPIPIRMVTSR